MSISICNHCGQSLIAILEKSLINQGLSLSIPDPIDAEIINGTKCEKMRHIYGTICFPR